MSTWLLFSVLGLGAGAVYAALAVGLILVYRGSGVVNFALGAMAMYPAMAFHELRTEGDLVLPLIVVPARLDLGSSVPLPVAFALALLVAAIIGLAAFWLIFSHLQDAPAVTKVIASVGLTIVLQGVALLHFGQRTRRADAILPAEPIHLLGRPVPQDRLWLTGLVIVVGVVLAAVYRYTRFGLATRAVASNPKGAQLLGHSPAWLGTWNWVAAAVLAGAAGILVSPVSGVNPFNYSLFVVPALAAALAARLRNFGIAIVTGLALGIFEGLSVHLVSRRQVPIFLLGGFDAMVPFLVIVGALVLVGHTLPTRGTMLEDRQPAAPMSSRRRGVWIAGIALTAAVMAWGDSSLRLATMETLVVVSLMLSMVVLTGYIGQVSLAQLSFAGFAAFMLARFADQWGLPFPLSPLLAIAVTTVVGTTIGIPALRIRGIQYAIVTLAAAVAIEQVLFRNPSFVGIGGLAHVDPPELLGADLGIIGPGEYPYRGFGFLALGVTVACLLLVVNIRRSAVGRRFLAVRINERAAAAAGIDVARTKLTASALASFLAAVSGVLFAYKNVDFSQVGLEASRGLQVLALAYLGGIGSVAGALIAASLTPAGLFAEVTGSQGSSTEQFLITGIGLIIVAIRLPGGIAGAGPWLVRTMARLQRRPSRPAQPGDDGLPSVEVIDASSFVEDHSSARR